MRAQCSAGVSTPGCGDMWVWRGALTPVVAVGGTVGRARFGSGIGRARTHNSERVLGRWVTSQGREARTRLWGCRRPIEPSQSLPLTRQAPVDVGTKRLSPGSGISPIPRGSRSAQHLAYVAATSRTAASWPLFAYPLRRRAWLRRGSVFACVLLASLLWRRNKIWSRAMRPQLRFDSPCKRWGVAQRAPCQALHLSMS